MRYINPRLIDWLIDWVTIWATLINSNTDVLTDKEKYSFLVAELASWANWQEVAYGLCNSAGSIAIYW